MSTLQPPPPPPTLSASPSNKNNGALPFNKMFIMIPVMLAARKLNNEDVNTVMMIRIAYGVIQMICLSIVLYTYLLVSSLTTNTTKNMDRIVYIPAPPQVWKNTTEKK
jgi:Phosphate transport (Pho88)